MTPDRWQQIEELYHAARERGHEVLSDADPALREEVERLLAEDSGGKLLDGAAADLVSESTVMKLTAGTQLGPYRIDAPIGAGGMGQVFRATDTRLGRPVAIKTSQAQFSERFEREARAISSLNHAHVCTLYDVGPNYLVMELVEGETLAARLKRGKLSIEDTLKFGAQIAGALAAAHAKGMIHRDLKPGNIMLTKAGVKVLDFGLAKSQHEPTMTASNVVMGTPAYMAPEQFEGNEADARTDTYAFGLVLYELATGTRAPHGQMPPLDHLPEKLAHVVERCLAPDPEERWQSAQDVKAELQWLASSKHDLEKPARKSWKPWTWVSAAVLILGAAAVAVIISEIAATPLAAPPFTFRIPIPAGLRMITRSTFSISPDGKTIAFLAARSDDVEHIWIQRLGEAEARLLPGTESPPYPPSPFWSPDSKTLVFYAEGKLKKIGLDGSSPQTICDVSTFASGGAWREDGLILFGDLGRGVMRVSESGGTPVQLTSISSGERAHVFPAFLPDGRHFLYMRAGGPQEVSGIYVGDLGAAPAQQDSRRLLATTSAAQIVQLKGGRIKVLFLRSDTLMAQDFDVTNLRLTGEPVAAAEPVGFSLAFAFFAASANTLAYRAPVEQTIQLHWFDGDGKKGAAVGDPIARQATLALSPDGRTALLSRWELATADSWLLDLTREIYVRLTTGPGFNVVPVWAPDGKRFVFSSSRSGPADLFVGAADGEMRSELLLQSNVNKTALSWSPDGRLLLYRSSTAGTKDDLYILPMEQGRAGTPIPFAVSGAAESDARFSPDGHWIAYVSDETGSAEIYARAFQAGANVPSAKIRISKMGGMHPRWPGNGKELFYSAPNGNLMTVSVSGRDTLSVGTPQMRFFMAPNAVWDVAPDGKRFLIGVPVEQDTQTPFTVVMNWMAQLKQ